MPNDPMTNPASSSLNSKPEVRKALPAGPEKPQWLEGKLTYIGLVLATIGSIGKMFGISLPTSEAEGFLRLISENWDTIATGIGLLTAAWGRIRINFRKAASLLIFGLMLSQLSAADKPKLGWKSAPAHKKGLTQFVKHPSYKLAPLPPAASLRDQMPPVYDQRTLGSCTAQAGSAAFDYAYKVIHGQFAFPSRLDLYQQELLHDGPAKAYPALQDNGSYTSSILWVLKNNGICQESKWAYNVSKLNVSPPTCAVKQRSVYMATKGYDVDTTDGRSIKEAIANAKRPVVFGALVYNGIFNVNASNPVIPMPSGPVVGGHEMVFTAYSDAKQAYLVRNSWSESWGDKGYAWMSYAYVHNPRYVEDALVIEVVK